MFLTTENVQAWLQNTKYKISSVDQEFLTLAKEYIFGEVGQRYDTAAWLDSATTPTLILHLMAMQVASYELRRAASEEDGRTTYADFLDKRVCDMCASIVSGGTILSGAILLSTDPVGIPQFFPEEGSDQLYCTDDNFAPTYFSMKMQF